MAGQTNAINSMALLPSSYWEVQQLFTHAQCDELLTELATLPWVKESRRRSLMLGEQFRAMHDRVYQHLAEVNKASWFLKLDRWMTIQAVCYEPGDDYPWHMDLCTDAKVRAPSMKLGASILLSNPDAFEGGELELMLGATHDPVPGGPSFLAPLNRGTCIAFPGYVLHRVRPVTAGVRHALVVHLRGPAFA